MERDSKEEISRQMDSQIQRREMTRQKREVKMKRRESFVAF